MAKRKPLDESSWTLERFLDWRETRPRDERWEYIGVPHLKGTPLLPLPDDVGPLMMSPERTRHAHLKGEIYRLLADKLRGNPCRALVDGPQVRAGGVLLQPDVVVTCEAIDWKSTEITAPVVIVEVLSPTAEADDKGRKFMAYRALPSFEHYLLVAQDRRLLIHHERVTADEWRQRFVEAGEVELGLAGLTLGLDEVYAASGV